MSASGTSKPHESAVAQVAGAVNYIDDIPEVRGTLHAAAILSRAADLCDVWVGLQLPPWVAAGRALAAVERYRRSARRWLLLTRIAPSDPREPEALTRARAHLFAAAVLRRIAD